LSIIFKFEYKINARKDHWLLCCLNSSKIMSDAYQILKMLKKNHFWRIEWDNKILSVCNICNNNVKFLFNKRAYMQICSSINAIRRTTRKGIKRALQMRFINKMWNFLASVWNLENMLKNIHVLFYIIFNSSLSISYLFFLLQISTLFVKKTLY